MSKISVKNKHGESIFFTLSDNKTGDISFLLTQIMKWRKKMIKDGTPTNIIHKFDKHFNIL